MNHGPLLAKVNLVGYGLVIVAVFVVCTTTQAWLGVTISITLTLVGLGIVIGPGLQQRSGLAALATLLCVVAAWTLGASLAFVSSAT